MKAMDFLVADRHGIRLRHRQVGTASFVWILLTSGTVLPNTADNVRITLLVSSAIFLVQLVLLLNYARKRLVLGALATYATLVGVVATTMVANSDTESYLTYARLLLAVGIACGCAMLIDRSAVLRVLVNFVTFFAAISLIFFYGDLVSLAPGAFNTLLLNETQYFNSYVYMQLVVDASRNTAIYIEPGLYQIYLCLALMVLFYSSVDFRYRYLKVAVLVVALLSTKSTAGYLAGLLVFSGLAFTYKPSKFRALFLALRVMVVAMVVLYLVSSSYFTANIEAKFSGQSQLSWMGRRDSTLADLAIISESPFFGTGAGSYLKEIDAFGAVGYEIAAATNTYTQLSAVFGLLFMLPILVLQIGALWRVQTSLGIRLLLAAVWAVSFLNQPFVMYSIFYLPAFLFFNRGARIGEDDTRKDRFLNGAR